MRVFVTGASGHIGSAVVPELLQAGHAVVGLARSDRSAAALAEMGADVHRGSLDDLDSLRHGAAGADGVIHLAFDHEAMVAGDMGGAAQTDLAAVSALAEPLVGTGKALVGTSGTLMLLALRLDRPGTENDAIPGGGYRIDAENEIVGLADQDVRSSVVRLPPVVHSSLDAHGFIPTLIAAARAAGRFGYLDDGLNRWPAVHTLDAARAYRLALETAPAGSRLHAVGDEGIRFREIAESIGRHLAVPVSPIPADETSAVFTWLAPFVGADNPTSATLTRQLLGWEPGHPGLLADLDEGHYFAR